MKRREFIRLAGVTALCLSRSGHAQTNASLPVVGVLMPFKHDADFGRERIAALRAGLQDAGFVDGKNVSIVLRFGEGQNDRMPMLVKELAALNPRVIVTIANGASLTHTLLPEMPVVFTAISADPIKLGLAESYAPPGGMITGNVMNAVG